ncbi:MAG: hypothetical protein KBF88_01635 [Polyangiaceae bacterium]|nr:hypothetical protein [Polyangiaceae bacterium]
MRKGHVGIVLAGLLGVPACALVAGVSEPTFRDSLPDSDRTETTQVDAIAIADAKGDAVPSSFCALRQGAHFCADFEDPLAPYGQSDTTGGGINGRDGAAGYRSQASLKFTSTDATYPANAGSLRVIPLPQTLLSKVTMEGVFRTSDMIPASELMALMRIELNDGSDLNQCRTMIFRYGPQLYLNLQGMRRGVDEYEDLPVSDVPIGQWTSIRIVADISSNRVQVYVNEVMLVDHAYAFPGGRGDSASYGQTSYRDALGSIPARTVAWDNVVVDLL